MQWISPSASPRFVEIPKTRTRKQQLVYWEGRTSHRPKHAISLDNPLRFSNSACTLNCKTLALADIIPLAQDPSVNNYLPGNWEFVSGGGSRGLLQAAFPPNREAAKLVICRPRSPWCLA